MFKYYIALTVLVGSAATYAVSSDLKANAAMTTPIINDSPAVKPKNFTEEISRERVYRSPIQSPSGNNDFDSRIGAVGIPTIILPNNVCVINTDISPDRTIEDHIMACIQAQKIRRSLTQ